MITSEGYLGSEQKLFEKKLSFDSDPKYSCLGCGKTRTLIGRCFIHYYTG